MARRRRSPVLPSLLRLLVGIAVLVVVVAILGAAAGLLLIDPNHYKPEIEAAVQRATGRVLTLRGPVHIGFGLPPTFVADDVALANMPGGSRPQMLTLNRLEARVALLPLLSGEIDVVRLDLIKPDLLLETDAAGRANWQFARPAKPPSAAPSAAEPAAAPARAGRFALQALHVRDGHVVWRDGRTRGGGDIAVPRLDAEASGPDASLVISGEVASGGRTLTLSGETGSIARLLDPAASTPWPVQLTAQNEGARLAVRGSVLHPLLGTGYTLQLDATATDLAAIVPFLPAGTAAPHDLSLSAQLSDTAGAGPQMTAITLHVGGLKPPDLPPGTDIVRADLSAPGLTQPLHADMQATYDGVPLHVIATVGSLAALLPNAPPGGAAPLDVTIESAGATLTAKGTVSALSRKATVDASVSALIPDLAALAPLAGRALPGFKQIGLTFHVAGSLDGPVALRQASLSMPQAQIVGDLDIVPGPRPSVRGSVQASRIDLDGLLAELAAPPGPTPASQPAPATAPPAARPDRPAHLISDEPLDFAWLDRQDADVQMAIAALQTGGVTYSDIAGHLLLRDGHLTLDPFAGTTPGGRLEAKLDIDARPAAPPVAVTLHAPAIALQPIAAALGDPEAATGTASVDADLRGAGRTPHAIAASLDGHLNVAVSDGEIDNRVLATALGAVLKAAKLPETALGAGGRSKLRCLVVRLDAVRGLVTVPTLVADTTRLLIQGSGTLDLGAETLALHLRPMLRAGPGIVVPVRLSGSFRDPKLAGDFGGKAGVLASLAAIAAGERGGDACGPALAAARGAEAGVAAPAATPVAAPAAPSPKPKPPKPIDILRSLLSH